MEIFQNIWTALTTSNPELGNIIAAPFIVVESIVMMLLFTALLNFDSTKKQKIIYVIVVSIWTLLSNYLIPKPYGLYLNMIIGPIIIYFTFRTTVWKSIASMLIMLLSVAIFETIIGQLYYTLVYPSYEVLSTVPLYRFSIAISIYICIYLVYRLAKKYNLNSKLKKIKFIKNSSKALFFATLIFGIIAVATQSYLIVFYNAVLPFPIVIATSISLIAYVAISIYSLYKTSKLETTTQSLEESKFYNKTLELLYDNTRAFKHDFGNIIQAIGGYIVKEDIEGLKKFYNDLCIDCVEKDNLSTLNPTLINNPAIYSILASKYYEADKYGIKIYLQILFNLNTLHMKTYQFTRILGILLDNAIYAAKECKEKYINVYMRDDPDLKRQVVIIENTYMNKDIDTEKIFEKGYSTKPKDINKPTGVGLWEVREILRKNENLNLFTTKDDMFFTQQLEIYEEE